MAYTKYSLTPANNTAAPPDGAPEGMLPSAVNDTMRDMMAQIRDVGDGVRDGTYTMTTPKITGGTITGVTLTGNTLTNPVITGATLTTSAFNGTVGATTASTGAFTTLSTSSTTTLSGLTASTALALDASKNVVSVTNTGTGNNVLSASPTLTGTIAGASLSLSSLTSGRVTFAGASGLLSDSANLQFNGTNLGIGATPSAWDSTFRVLQDSTAVFAGRQDGSAQAWIGNNWYYNSGFIYKTTGLAAYYLQNGAIHSWHTAPSGTAGNTATFTQAMTLDANGSLALGATAVASSNGGMTITCTSSGSSSAPLTLRNAGTANGSGVYLIYRGVTNTGAENDYGYFNMVADDTTAKTSSMRFSTANGSSPVERMRIDSSGNVGIGVTPSSFQSVDKVIQIGAQGSIDYSSGNFLISNNFSNPGSVDKYIASTYATMYYQSTTGQHIWRLAPSGTAGNNISWTQAMTLDASGNLLVGTTSSIGNSGVIQGKGSGAVLYLETNSSSGSQNVLDIANVSNTAYKPMRFWVNGYPTTEVGSITCTTSLTSYNVTSDYRLKENIAPMTGALAKVAQLNPVTYKWKTDGSDGQGFIAHELQAVVPDCVTGEKDAVDENGKPQYQAMDTSHLVATLVSAIQELKAEVDSLKQQLNGA